MSYQPKHQPQLGRGIAVPDATQGSMDCGPRTLQMGIDKLTKGAKVPGPEKLRERMGTPGPQPTSVYDAQRGVESYDDLPGLKPLTYTIRRKTDVVKDDVRDGKYLQLCVDYGVLNDLLSKTGDPGFRGGHSVGVYGQKKVDDGTVKWLLWDPLDDGRRAEIPVGPRWVKRSHLVDALEAFGGGPNSVYAGKLGGGGAVEDDPCADAVADANARAVALAGELEFLQLLIDRGEAAQVVRWALERRDVIRDALARTRSAQPDGAALAGVAWPAEHG